MSKTSCESSDSMYMTCMYMICIYMMCMYINMICMYTMCMYINEFARVLCQRRSERAHCSFALNRAVIEPS